MIVASGWYLVFLCIVVLLHYLLPPKLRWLLLLVASIGFYGYLQRWLILVLFGTILVSHVGGRIVAQCNSSRMRQYALTGTVACLAALLVVFKTLALPDVVPSSGFLLPLGISYFCLRGIAHLIDMHTGAIAKPYHFGHTAVSIAFFPTIVAGPIERTSKLLPQIARSRRLKLPNLVQGMERIGWGLFKKLVIADRLAVIVNRVYAAPAEHSASQVTIAVLLFSIQLLMDFSAYTDIARGSAKMLGIDIVPNFRLPYAAVSVRDFWRRWHISLTRWFRDYVYIPLGGSRVRAARWVLNVLIVFILSGIWHGSQLTFLVWGGLHGVYLVLEEGVRRSIGTWVRKRAYSPAIKRVGRLAGLLITFTVVSVFWVFFRAESLVDSAYILSRLYRGWDFSQALQLGLGAYDLAIVGISLVIVCAACWVRERMPNWRVSIPKYLKWGLYYALLMLLLLWGEFGLRGFIYAQF